MYQSDRNQPHWNELMEFVRLKERDMSEHQRVWNLKLPPSSYESPLNSFYHNYPEWITPSIYRNYWLSNDLYVRSQAGVSLVFQENLAEPITIPPRPYATIEASTGLVIPVPANRIIREPNQN